MINTCMTVRKGEANSHQVSTELTYYVYPI